MLEIIGWMGCAYLFIKGLELLAIGDDKPLTKVAAGIAFFSGLLFFVMLQMQTQTNSAADAADRLQAEDPEGYGEMVNGLDS